MWQPEEAFRRKEIPRSFVVIGNDDLGKFLEHYLVTIERARPKKRFRRAEMMMEKRGESNEEKKCVRIKEAARTAYNNASLMPSTRDKI